MSLVPDRKLAIAIRDDQIKVAKSALDQARVSDGNEGWTDTTQPVDWLRIRNGNNWGGGNLLDGPGQLWGGWDAISWGGGYGGGNSSAY